MIPVFSVSDAFTFVRLAKWAILRHRRKYEEGVFMCAHVLFYMAKELFGVDLRPTNNKHSALLADWWFRMSDAEPGPGKDPILLRFQSDNQAISELRPNGIVHVEIVIHRPDLLNDSGICLGVGIGVLNGEFGFHPFGKGIPNDGWYDESERYGVLYRYLNSEKLLAMDYAKQLMV